MLQLLVTLGFIDQLFTKEKKELKIIYFCPNFLHAYFEELCQPNIVFFTRQNMHTRNIWRASVVLRARTRLVGIMCAIGLGL